jgi:lysophospholipase L1-like esterase
MKHAFARRRLVLAIAILILSTVGTEIGLRLTVGLGDPPLFQSDPEIGYMMVANQEVRRLGNRIKINSFHQRSDDLTPLPADGIKRLFFLGDSITFGVAGVDQTEIFPELVGADLRATGQEIEVMDASAVSWGIGNELAYVRRFGTFGSKIAILEIGSADLLQPTSVGDGVGVNASQPDRRPFSAIGELFERVLIPRFVEIMGYQVSGNEPVTIEDRTRQFEENMRHFTNLVAKVRQQGSLPLVIMMPGLTEVTQRHNPAFQRYAPYRDGFRKRMEQLDVQFVDMSVVWRNDPNINSYYTDGTHLTAAGNRALSKEIVATIKMM